MDANRTGRYAAIVESCPRPKGLVISNLIADLARGALGEKESSGKNRRSCPHRFHLARSVRKHSIPPFRPPVKSVDRQFVSRMVGEPGRWRLVAQKRFADSGADLSKGERGQLLTEVGTRLGAVASLHSGPVSLCSGSQTGCFSLGRNL